MYGIFTYIYPQNYPNVGKYTIHWASGIVEFGSFLGEFQSELLLLKPILALNVWYIYQIS